MNRVGFIGVGIMGAPMARCLLRAGYRMTICDTRSEALEKFKGTAARVTSLSKDCRDTEMVIIMVGDDSQVEEVLLGSEGLLNAVDPERPPLLAIMTTVMPQTVNRLASLCAKRNVRVTDAPVSGSPVLAEEGKLSIMVGGEEADLEAMRPIFETMGKNIYHTGGLGTGTATKLVNNIIGLTNLFLFGEVMQIGKKLGMDPERLASIFETSTGRAFLTKDWEKSRKIFEVFSQTSEVTKRLVELARIDFGRAHQLARDADISSPLLDNIIQAVNRLPHEEVKEKWHSLI